MNDEMMRVRITFEMGAGMGELITKVSPELKPLFKEAAHLSRMSGEMEDMFVRYREITDECSQDMRKWHLKFRELARKISDLLPLPYRRECISSVEIVNDYCFASLNEPLKQG